MTATIGGQGPSWVWQSTGEKFEVMFQLSDPAGQFYIREKESLTTSNQLTTNPRISELYSLIMDLRVKLREDGAALSVLSTRTAEHRQELVEMGELLSALHAELKGTPSE